MADPSSRLTQLYPGAVGAVAEDGTPQPGRSPDVLVTLADRRYLAAAKQLFASAYFEGGWRGDYLLLSNGLDQDDVAWFTERGIYVVRCESVVPGEIGGMASVLSCKLHLFTPWFRRWRTVVYSDADCMIRGRISSLGELQGFRAPVDWNPSLRLQVATPRTLAKRGADARDVMGRLRRRPEYDPRATAFCAGFFVMRSRLIADDTFDRLLSSVRSLCSASRFGDQLFLNLHFRKQWRPLSPAVHLLVRGSQPPWPVRKSAADALSLHFVGPSKPWLEPSRFSAEWHRNAGRADDLDLRSIPQGRVWSQARWRAASSTLRRGLAIGSAARRWLSPLRLHLTG